MEKEVNAGTMVRTDSTLVTGPMTVSRRKVAMEFEGCDGGDGKSGAAEDVAK